MIEDKTLWLVKLSDGQEIHSEQMSWTSLRNHVQEHNLKISQMQLRFRDHVVPMPDNARGYYFSEACGATMGHGGFNFFVTGVLKDDDTIERIWFYVPELEVHKKDVKLRNKVFKEGLITNE